jgi:hypothetical protein
MFLMDRIRPDAVVIVYLKDPKERFWGVMRSLDATGTSVLGVDLMAFDDWLRALGSGQSDQITPSLVFYPLQRVEKILLDMPAGEIPSLWERFESRTGRTLHEFLGLRAQET